MKGKTPTLISGVPKVAPSRATTRSQASASPSAPARTCPEAAQMDGLPSSPSSRKTSGKRSVPQCLRTSGTSAAKPERLPPELNVLGFVEASTTHRTASSTRARRSASSRSPSSSSDSALRVSGSSSATVATPSATS